MNKQTNYQETIFEKSNNPIIIPHKTKRIILHRVFKVITILASIIIVGFIILLLNRSKIEKDLPRLDRELCQLNLDVWKDIVFKNGFRATGYVWPLIGSNSLADLKINPLCSLRKDYCFRIGYQYPIGYCGCYLYQYYKSYDTYTNSNEAFTVYYPLLWEKNAHDANCGVVTDSQISLNRQALGGAACNIRYGIIDDKTLLSYPSVLTKQINVGYGNSNDIDRNYNKLDKITLGFDRNLSNEEKASGYTNEKLISIPHFPYADSKYGFLLTSGDNQPLLEACVEEFDDILDSRVINYPATQLTDKSNGIIYFQWRLSDFENYVELSKNIKLIFRNSLTSREESVLPDIFSKLPTLSEYFLEENKIYYFDGPANNPTIKTIDIFTGENQTIQLQYDTNKPVHSFFIRNDTLYYLMGEFCNEYLHPCTNMELKSYNLISRVTQDLVEGSTSREIVGFDASGNGLILQWSEADVVLVGKYELFTFSNRTLKQMGRYVTGGEGGEDGSYQTFEKLLGGSGTFNYFTIKDGKITPLEQRDGYSDKLGIKTNIAP